MHRQGFHWLLVVAFFGLCAAFLAACGDTTSVAGGSSEETNAIVGIVVDENGSSVAGARVSLYDSDYIPAAGALSKSGTITLVPLGPVRTFTMADSNGEWKISNIPGGRYRLETKSDQGHKSTKMLDVPDYGLVEAGATMVRPVGALQGLVSMAGEAASGVKVIVPGSDYSAISDEHGYFRIDELPRDSMTLMFQASDPRVYSNFSLSVLPTIDMQNAFEPNVTEGWDGNYTDQYAGDMLLINIPMIQDSILISYWNWDSLSADEFIDQNGVVPNGVLYGGTLEESPWQKALKLSGANDFGVVELQPLNLQSLPQYSLSAFLFVDPESIVDSMHLNLLGQLGFNDEQDVFSLALIRNMCGYTELQAGFFLGSVGNTARFTCDDLHTSTDAGLTAGEWTHIAVTYQAGETLSMYVNGELVLRDSIAMSDSALVDSLPWYFGKSNFHGKLDEVKIFSQALSDADIRQLYEATWESADSDFRQQMDQNQ